MFTALFKITSLRIFCSLFNTIKGHIYFYFDYFFFKIIKTCFDASQSFQILEEPGEDNTKFDNIVPTIVKPKTAEEFIVESALKGHVG